MSYCLVVDRAILGDFSTLWVSVIFIVNFERKTPSFIISDLPSSDFSIDLVALILEVIKVVCASMHRFLRKRVPQSLTPSS